MSPERRRFGPKQGLLVAVAVAVLLLWGWRAARRGVGDQPEPTRGSTEQPAPSGSRSIAAPATNPAPADTIDLELRTDPEATVLVEGVVVDTLGGPIEGARIAARQRADRDALPVALARSDEQGRFALWLRSGRLPDHASLLWLNARAEDYAEATVVVRTPTRSVRVALFAESLLAGVVETESGEPVPGVAVELGPPPLSLLPNWPRAVTDERGRFEIHSLAPGSYRPIVDDGRWYAQLERIELRFLERRDDLRIVVSAGHHVRVDVRAPDGSACLDPHARIIGLQASDRRSYASSKRDEDGLVCLAAIPSGEHRLVAGCQGALEVEQQVEITADATFEITTAEGLSLRGRTIDERGEPVPGVLVRAEPPSSGLAHSVNGTESDERGEFELRGLAPGKLLVTGSRSDRLSAPPVAVELLAGDTPPVVELRLDRGHCVIGQVEGGPESLLVAALSGHRAPTELRLSSSRGFEICGFEPDGEGRLWLEDGATRTHIPFIHDATEIQQLELNLPEESERPLALRVVAAPDRTLQIRIESDDGPVDDALVRLVQRLGSSDELIICGRPFPIEVVSHGVTDDGTLLLEGLWPGRYYVHAEAEHVQGCAVVSLDERSPSISINLAR